MRYIKKLLLILVLFVSTSAFADEGMWLPQLLEKLNESRMKSLGMKISAKDIYSINKGSLKDAIVSFGGCTAEIISTKGLMLTNHHCGFDAIQNHSTLEHNFLRDGFWARTNSEEIPNPGLTATFIIRIEDVTTQVLNNLTPTMTESERQSQIDKNIAEIRKSVKKESYQDSYIRGFFEGNQYYLFVTETYKDVRLVGAPPSSIGNFGVDTDNWMWPRHTGDFSLFRIYAGPDNKPAEYSPDNKPYVPKRSLSISLDGVKEGDFTMVFGFPGATTEYLHSKAVQQIMELNDPAKIAIRTKALGVLDAFMRKDEQIKIQYAAKYASISNAWKKWQGEIMGLTRTNAISKKRTYEAEFQKRVNANTALKTKYAFLLDDLTKAYEEFGTFSLARDYYNEIIGRTDLNIKGKIEIFNLASYLNTLIAEYEKSGETGYNKQLVRVKSTLEEFYKEYNTGVDQKLFEALMPMYISGENTAYISEILLSRLEKEGKNIEQLASKVYNETDIYNPEITLGRLSQPAGDVVKYLKNDATIILYNDILKTYQTKVQGKLSVIQNHINQLQRTYMQAQMEVMKEKTFYPDANRTMRVTYGNVNGYTPRDAVGFDYYTYLDGVIEKYKPGDYEFDLPQKLIDLYKTKDYGQYGAKGKMPVCFIASNHTTGGNSGSPALDAYGNLVGLNFDRVWEGTMSDINYDPSICRNIMVDIRYVLFIIDKYAGATNLIQELRLVHPRKK